LYIHDINYNSIIQKYNADPLIATALYYSLFSFIYFVFYSASINFTATSFAYVFVEFNTSINSVSSNKFPYELINLSNKFLSNIYKSFLFLLTSANN
jgi:hypothetical protein